MASFKKLRWILNGLELMGLGYEGTGNEHVSVLSFGLALGNGWMGHIRGIALYRHGVALG